RRDALWRSRQSPSWRPRPSPARRCRHRDSTCRSARRSSPSPVARTRIRTRGRRSRPPDPTVVSSLPPWLGFVWGIWTKSPAYQRAVAVLERTEGLVGRNGGAQLVEVARIFRLRRLLHLEQVGRVQLAAVGADRARAEQRIIGRQPLHLGDHGGAV